MMEYIILSARSSCPVKDVVVLKIYNKIYERYKNVLPLYRRTRRKDWDKEKFYLIIFKLSNNTSLIIFNAEMHFKSTGRVFPPSSYFL